MEFEKISARCTFPVDECTRRPTREIAEMVRDDLCRQVAAEIIKRYGSSIKIIHDCPMMLGTNMVSFEFSVLTKENTENRPYSTTIHLTEKEA